LLPHFCQSPTDILLFSVEARHCQILSARYCSSKSQALGDQVLPRHLEAWILPSNSSCRIGQVLNVQGHAEWWVPTDFDESYSLPVSTSVSFEACLHHVVREPELDCVDPWSVLGDLLQAVLGTIAQVPPLLGRCARADPLPACRHLTCMKLVRLP